MKRIGCAMLAMIILLCVGCDPNFDNMTTEEILASVTKCSDEQIQNIANVLAQCGVSKISNIQMFSERQGSITCPEGELEIGLDYEKNLNYISIHGTGMDLCNHNTVLATLISSPVERQYYFDTTSSMISSIEDDLVTVQTFYGLTVDKGTEETPQSFDYDGKQATCRTLDGIVHVSCTIYGYTSKNQKVSFSFKAEYAMLYPVSLQLPTQELH